MAIVDRMGEHAARALGRTRKDLRVLAARRRLAKARGVLSVDFDGEGIGFFAQMNGLLRLGRYAMEHDLVPDIRFLSSNYKDLARGADWLSYYFDRHLSFPELRSRKPIYIRDLSEFPVTYDTDLSLHEANALIFRFYRLRPEIEQAVAEFSSANGVGENTLGIHYRGTDKSSEAPRVSEQRVVENALAYLKANRSVDTVFLASDEAAFIDYARAALKNYRISCLPDSIRSLDGSADPPELIRRGLSCRARRPAQCARSCEVPCIAENLILSVGMVVDIPSVCGRLSAEQAVRQIPVVSGTGNSEDGDDSGLKLRPRPLGRGPGSRSLQRLQNAVDGLATLREEATACAGA